MKTNNDIKYQELLFCGMIAPVILGVIIFSVGYITTDYNPISDSISLMGTSEQPYAWILNYGYYLYSILMVSAAYGLNRIFYHVKPVRRLSVLLGVHAFGTILLAVFPDSTTSVSREFIHNVISALAYVPLLVGIYIFRGIAKYNITFRVTVFLGFFVILINLPMPFIHMTEPLSSIGGLLQRIFLCCSFLWLILTFFLLYKTRYSIGNDMRKADFISSPRVTNHASTGPAVTKVGNILQDT